MILTYVIAFLVTLCVVLAMALGVIISGKRIRGSCGGLNCSNCDKRSQVCQDKRT